MGLLSTVARLVLKLLIPALVVGGIISLALAHAKTLRKEYSCAYVRNLLGPNPPKTAVILFPIVAFVICLHQRLSWGVWFELWDLLRPLTHEWFITLIGIILAWMALYWKVACVR